ncbi:hypothetical protein FPV67DRAFT_1450767 [Lyophyllum atratum]|nr:hypothetical protein FPV67DRAFT_1450767 [Lyophyllum atratum]
MAFSNAQHSNIYGSMFMDIGRDHYNIGGDQYNISKSESGAAFDSNERYPPARCHPGTRKEIIEKITHFVPVNRESGAGKSAIAQTIAEECAERKTLAASFFFSRGRQGRDTIDRVFTTIAYQLAILRSALRQILFDDPSIVQKNIFVQLQKLVIEPLQASVSSSPHIPSSPTPSLVIIDGLDECAGKDHQDQLLKHILTLVRTPCVPLRFLIVSRPESNIRRAFEKTDLSQFCAEPISFYGGFQSRDDVHKYLLDGFNRIYTSDTHEPWMASVSSPWPTTADVNLLAWRCDGYFIYASTLVRFIDQEWTSPLEQLDIVLKGTPGSDAFEELDKLYHQILSTIPDRDITVLKTVLSAVLLARDPTLKLIGDLFLLETGQVSITLRGLQSVVRDIGLGGHVPIHTSFRDFLFDPCSKACQASFSDPTSIPRQTLTTALYSYQCWFDHLIQAGSHRTALVKEVMAMDDNCWIPLPPENVLIPWHDKKFSDLKTLCAGGIAMLDVRQEDLIQLEPLKRLCDKVICRLLAPKCLQDTWILSIFTAEYDSGGGAGGMWYSPTRCFGSWSTFEGAMIIQGLLGLQRPFSYHTFQIYEVLNALASLSRPLSDLRHYLTSKNTPAEVFLDSNTSQTHLAHQCMELLTADVDKVMDSKKFYWANHLTNAPSGDEELLRHLQSIDRQHLFNGEYFDSTLTYLKKLEEGVQIPPKRSYRYAQEKEVIEEHDRVILVKLNGFIYRALWGLKWHPHGLLSSPPGKAVQEIRRSFLFDDICNVRRVIRWLKEGPQSANREDLVRRWEAYHEKLRAHVEPRNRVRWEQIWDGDDVDMRI